MAGIDGFGTQLKRGDGGGPETFTAIANVTNIGGPSLSRETYDTTTHGSPDGWREFIGGLRDGGEVSADINYDPDEHDSLFDDFDDVESRTWQVVFPPAAGSAVWQFEAILTGFEPTAPHDDKLTATVSFKVTGKPTLS